MILPSPPLFPAHAAWWGRQPYLVLWQAMRAYTERRQSGSPDWLWAVEHDPVYTLGLAGQTHHLTSAAHAYAPVVRCDRGGQVTWHGPGQLVLYCLWDLRRRSLTVRGLVALLEEAVIALLARHGIVGERRPRAPGVYVGGAKIASLGLKVTRGYSYHGLSLNVTNDLTPFSWIDPCGFAGLPVTRTSDWGWSPTLAEAAKELADHLPPGQWVWQAPPTILSGERDGFASWCETAARREDGTDSSQSGAACRAVGQTGMDPHTLARGGSA